MKTEGLFEISSYRREGESHIFGVTLDGSHPVFEGHFPGRPVLPGVCSMYIIKECAGRAAGLKLGYESVKDCKFLSAVLPGKHGTLSVTVIINRTGEDEFNLTATISAGEETMVKIKAALKQQ